MIRLISIVLFYLLVACKAQTNTNIEQGFLSIENSRFVDENGREVILNGLNHVNKNPKQGHINQNDEMLFKQFKQWGFNIIRYGINWAHLEPQPGVINEAYLKEIDKRVHWAKENNIWLILDMHQDLYGAKYDNGAPLWATIDNDLPHIKGDVWSDSYLISPAVHKAFDNFWANELAPDSIGIQDHYINCWSVIAQRYASESSVAGFDIMNEPFMGSGATMVLPKLIEGYASAIYHKEGKILSEQELMRLFESESSRVEILASLNDKQMYAALLSPAIDIVNKFEEGALSKFYQKVRDAIRKESKKQIIFLEHNYFCNLGIESTFLVPTDENGKIDELCAYAPHGYDLVTDTDGASNPGENRVAFIFEQIFKSARWRKLATIIGEWGAFYVGENKYYEPAKQIISIFEQNLAGQTYWAYWDNLDTQDYFKGLLSRTYPMYIAGEIMHYHNNFDNGNFTLKWHEKVDNKLPSRIFINDINKIKNIVLLPNSSINRTQLANTSSGYIDIEPCQGERSLVIEMVK